MPRSRLLAVQRLIENRINRSLEAFNQQLEAEAPTQLGEVIGRNPNGTFRVRTPRGDVNANHYGGSSARGVVPVSLSETQASISTPKVFIPEEPRRRRQSIGDATEPSIKVLLGWSNGSEHRYIVLNKGRTTMLATYQNDSFNPPNGMITNLGEGDLDFKATIFNDTSFFTFDDTPFPGRLIDLYDGLQKVRTIEAPTESVAIGKNHLVFLEEVRSTDQDLLPNIYSVTPLHWHDPAPIAEYGLQMAEAALTVSVTPGSVFSIPPLTTLEPFPGEPLNDAEDEVELEDDEEIEDIVDSSLVFNTGDDFFSSTNKTYDQTVTIITKDEEGNITDTRTENVGGGVAFSVYSEGRTERSITTTTTLCFGEQTYSGEETGLSRTNGINLSNADNVEGFEGGLNTSSFAFANALGEIVAGERQLTPSLRVPADRRVSNGAGGYSIVDKETGEAIEVVPIQANGNFSTLNQFTPFNISPDGRKAILFGSSGRGGTPITSTAFVEGSTIYEVNPFEEWEEILDFGNFTGWDIGNREIACVVFKGEGFGISETYPFLELNQDMELFDLEVKFSSKTLKKTLSGTLRLEINLDESYEGGTLYILDASVSVV